MTNVRVQRGVSTEQKVAHRLSVTMNNQRTVDTLHIRSFSLPKEKTPQLTDTEYREQKTPSIATEHDEHDVDERLHRVMRHAPDNDDEPDTHNQHSSQPTITVTPASPLSGLPSSTVNNMVKHDSTATSPSAPPPTHRTASTGSQQLTVDTKYVSSHMSTVSDTQHTLQSEFSSTVYTENTEYTKDDESHVHKAGAAKGAKATPHKGRGGGSVMSVGSASSMTMSTYDSSQRKGAPSVLPPALETVNEPSAQNINTMRYADEEMLSAPPQHPPPPHPHHQVQHSVVAHMAAPHINLGTPHDHDDYDEDASATFSGGDMAAPHINLGTPRDHDDYDEDDTASDLHRDARKTRGSVDMGQGQPASAAASASSSSSSPSIWSCLLCCCASALHGDGEQTPQNEQKREEDEEDGDGGGGLLQLDSDDWRTYKSAGSRMRRPTQYTTATKDEDCTISPDDVRMFDDPFGKGASGRVFKGFYVPMCQVIALKVTSRLDNLNVKQILGEFQQQQDVLPDCDELMRIHGWYRNTATNEIAVALEYMDMGSVYDSCFNTQVSKSAAAVEQEIKSGHQQIVVYKLSYDQLRFIARQSLLGLHALHTNEPTLIHRDIKPQNILLSSFGAVKIADFGLMIELPRSSGGGQCTDSKGTSKYFSPERIQGAFDTRADIWSLGVTLIEIYRQELISAEDLDWFKIVEDGIDIDDLLPATTPTEFAEFLRECLQKDATQRPSAQQLLSHQFITRKWGNPLLDNNRLKFIDIRFSKEEGNQRLLDKLLSWLEEWILADEEYNANMFADGDAEFLKSCVLNLSKYSGLPPKYIDRYVADLYREYTQLGD
eukprot:CAMPEP_0202729938 /NCGR_PEP_ID=MMETSP1385-20130828/186386_1 /ASSEMBLY_ACC=CAM_ASM_000861 /TAXON_ID=933848 /ORGANISM="Elphidium margaritaceum" /LENGTH=830 /DNA_ID=CAMNT_0049396209 /DNA_START=216 /DNA_END=2709 /DNA_ORIENTATION=-